MNNAKDYHNRTIGIYTLDLTKRNLFASLLVGAIPIIAAFWTFSLKPAIEQASEIAPSPENTEIVVEICQSPYFVLSMLLLILLFPILMIFTGYLILSFIKVSIVLLNSKP